jgi:rubredoxin
LQTPDNNRQKIRGFFASLLDLQSAPSFNCKQKEDVMEYKKYKCKTCGHIYDEAVGDPRSGIAAGTRWEDIPADWECPKCGATKVMFTLVR